jgi:predicted dehydrogenase
VTPRRGVLIGAGGGARLAHLPAYAHDATVATRLAIVAAVDSRLPPPDLGSLPVFDSLTHCLTQSPADFADVCTPTATHSAMVLDALAHGLHVFCEKPVATSRSDARLLATAARAAGKVLFPCHQYRQNPAWVALRRYLDAGAIGRWHLAEFHVYRPEADRGAGTGAAAPWRGTRAQSLGGVLLDHGTHLLYLLLDAGGMPERVMAHTATLGHHDYDVEDTAHLWLDYGDRLATVTLTWAGVERENRIRFTGSDGMVEWIGGQLRLVRKNGEVASTDFTAQLQKTEYAGWMSRVLAQFADAMDRGESSAGVAEIEQVATLLEAAYHSADEGVAIRVS